MPWVMIISIRVTRAGINQHVIRGVLIGLVQFYPEKFGKLVNFELTQSWVKSLYQRMKFSRRAAATSRAVISRSLWNKIKSQFLNEISQKVLLHSIPDELIINADQTPPKCVHGSQGARSYFKCKFQWQKKYYLNSLWITWMAKFYRSNWFAKERQWLPNIDFPRLFLLQWKICSNGKETVRLKAGSHLAS